MNIHRTTVLPRMAFYGRTAGASDLATAARVVGGQYQQCVSVLPDGAITAVFSDLGTRPDFRRATLDLHDKAADQGDSSQRPSLSVPLCPAVTGPWRASVPNAAPYPASTRPALPWWSPRRVRRSRSRACSPAAASMCADPIRGTAPPLQLWDCINAPRQQWRLF